MGCCWPKPVDNLPPAAAADPRSLGTNPVQKPLTVSDRGGGWRSMQGSGRIASPNLKMFSLSDLKSATRNFRRDSFIGAGGFGEVFKGFLDERTLAPSRFGSGIPVAVKKSRPDSEQGLDQWQAEVKFLGKFSHPNLVKLIGYCWEDRQFLLVYEYMTRGSLENHLFNDSPETMAWNTRMKIATGAARGLAFLHTEEKNVIYRDFKASNILLDDEFNAKLSDFGLAKFGPDEGKSHVTTGVQGTYGYAAPEYLATGHLYVKSDVYGFGVVLLEMLTGLPVLDLRRPSGQIDLVEWAKPSLKEKKKLHKIVDPRLLGQYPSRAAFSVAQLILKCVQPDPNNRPSMDRVLETLQSLAKMQIGFKDFQNKSEPNSRQPSPRPSTPTPFSSTQTPFSSTPPPRW